MNPKKIQIPLPIMQQLLHHAQSSSTTEVCGLIGSSQKVPKSCYPVSNSHSQPECKFTFNPVEQIAAFKTLRAKGEELFALYHSHPHSTAYPSSTDLALVSYPEVLYLIISLNIKGVLELRGFHLLNLQVEEVRLSLYS
jgi:proteasome lid subunit RPN8/RPN11